jgi:transcription termination factor Rho
LVRPAFSKIHFSSNFSEGFQPSTTNIFMSDTQATAIKRPMPITVAGYLEISEKGFGFLRTAQNHFHPKPTDILSRRTPSAAVSCARAVLSRGPTQPPHRGTSPQLKAVDKVNEMTFQDYTKAVRFENLTSIDPIEKFKLETTPDLLETRVIDLVTPIGKGTRGSSSRRRARARRPSSSRFATPSPPTIPKSTRWCC